MFFCFTVEYMQNGNNVCIDFSYLNSVAIDRNFQNIIQLPLDSMDEKSFRRYFNSLFSLFFAPQMITKSSFYILLYGCTPFILYHHFVIYFVCLL